MNELSHIGPDGEARMVDVSHKEITDRVARAAGCIRMKPETLAAILANDIAKGNVIATAKIAGVLAAKRTSDLIPLCHSLPLTDVQLAIEPDPSLPGLRSEATVKTTGKTGVEMEAITAVAVSLITIYDMAKAIDRDMSILEISLLEKSGGRTGHWRRS
jgi:cyclic pyranopterin monophosphate synthase